jgi:hypothetical protein
MKTTHNNVSAKGKVHMKNLINLFLIIVSSTVSAQDTLNYEQIAFEFFKKEILPTYSQKKKLTVFIHATKMLDYLIYPVCDKNSAPDTLYYKIHDRIPIEVKGDKRFQIKSDPSARLYVEWVVGKGDVNIVSVSDFAQGKQPFGITHYIEIDRTGRVVKWCRNDYH